MTFAMWALVASSFGATKAKASGASNGAYVSGSTPAQTSCHTALVSTNLQDDNGLEDGATGDKGPWIDSTS